MLRSHGHEVRTFEKSNGTLLKQGNGLVNLARIASSIYHSPESEAEIGAVMNEFCPDVLHVHNYMLVLTPSVFLAAKARGIATVLTLHNYRLLCPSGQFFRNGKVCEWCFNGGGYWMPIVSRCYPGGSLVKTLVAVELHRKTKADHLLADRVDAYIALTEFSRKKHVDAGIPTEQLHVKQNFLADPLEGNEPGKIGYGAMFLGRLAVEKGVDVLLKAWKDIDYPLTIVGTGPDRAKLQAMASSQVSFTGYISDEEVLSTIQRSAFLIFPSVWYEGFGLTMIQAMACGRAVVATDLETRAEVVGDDAGLMCAANSPESLAAAVKRLIADPALCAHLGANGRRRFLERFSPEPNYELLMQIYDAAIAHAKSSRPRNGKELPQAYGA